MKRTIKFNLFPKKVGGVLVECRPIRMRVCYAGYRVDFRVGYSIEPEKWNEEEGRVISNTKNRFRQTAGEINKAITYLPGSNCWKSGYRHRANLKRLSMKLPGR